MDTRLQLIIEAQNKATAEINRIANDVTGLGKVTQASSSQMSAGLGMATKAFGALSVAAIAYQAVDIAKSFVDAGLAAERMNIGLKSALGGMNAAADAQQFLRKESERLGLVFADQVKSFVSLSAAAKGTSLEGEKTRQIFSAIAEASTALGLTSDATSGALQAIQQMMSKGTVSAEELRGQLGERLPGAFNVAAEAMGVTTQELGKMLEQGEIVASEFLPKFAAALKNQYSGAMDEAAKSTQAAVNRMNNAWDEAKRSIGEVLLPYVAAAAEAINSAIQSIAPSTLEAKAAKLRNDIAELKKQISQPFYFGGDKELLKAMEADLIRVEREMAGVGNRTGEWAKGVRDLQKDYSATFAKGDSWLAFYKGLDDAANKRLPSITGAHEDAEKAASKQAAAIERLNRGLYELAANSEKYFIQSVENRSYISDEDYNKHLANLEKMHQAEQKAMEKYLSQGQDKWIEHVQNRSYISDKEYNNMLQKQAKDQEDANKKATEAYTDLWEETWKSLRNIYADIIYDMLSGDLDSWDDYFQAIKQMFLRLIAEMVSLWSVNFIQGLFTGVNMSSVFGASTTSTLSTTAGAAAMTGALGSVENALFAVTDALGITTVAADSAAVAATHAATTTTGAAAAMNAAEAAAAGAAPAIEAASLSFASIAAPAAIAIGAIGAIGGALGLFASEDYITSSEILMAWYQGLDELRQGDDYVSGIQSLTEADIRRMQEEYINTVLMSPMTGWFYTEMANMQRQLVENHDYPTDDMYAAIKETQQAVIDAFYAGIIDMVTLNDLSMQLANATPSSYADLIAEIETLIGPSDEWEDLVIPVDAPDSIPVTYDANYGDPDYMASGGPVSANTPYIVGEIGPELFVPQTSGHILSNSNMQKLMGMGVKGYADGTTSLPYAVYDPYAISSGTTELEMWQDLYETTSDYMDLLTDTQKELEEINAYYEEQIALAQQLGVTEEELTSIYQMQAAAVAELTDAFWTDYSEYVDEMLGLTTDMGQAIDEVNQYYAEAIADATALGASQETLNQMYADQQAILDELAATFFDDYAEYADEMLGLTTEMGSAIAEVNQYYAEAIANAEALGASQETLNQMYADQQAIIDKIIQDAIDSTIEQSSSLAQPSADTLDEQLAQQIDDLNKQFEEMVKTLEEAAANGADVSDEMVQLYTDYNQAMANLMSEMAETILSKFDAVNEQIAYYNWQIANPGASQSKYYGDQAIALYNAMISNPEKMNLENISDTADLVNQWYSSIMSEIEQYAQQMANAVNHARRSIENLSGAIDDTIQSIKYSKYNLSLPTQKAETAAGDYAVLLAKATSGNATTTDIQAYRDFVETYLQQAQDAYKSSQTYQDIYAQVMRDLETVKNNVNSETFEQTLINELLDTNDSLANAADYMDEAATALGYTAEGLEEINETYLMAQDLIKDLIDAYTATGDTTIDTRDNVAVAYTAASQFLTTGDSDAIGATWSIVETTTFFGTLIWQELVKITANTATATGDDTGLLEAVNAAASYASAANTNAVAASSNAYGAYTEAKQAVENTYDIGSADYEGGTAATLAAKARYNSAYTNMHLGVRFLADGGIITSPTLAMIGEAGYDEAVIPLKDGYVNARITNSGAADPEIKAMLRQLVIQGAQKQHVALRLEDGRSLTGYLSSIADDVRVTGNTRSRMATRRGYLN